jgi:AcrR family transcriptional regulator
MSRPSDPHAKIDLLRAAEQVFVERGLDRAKVEEITALAGRSKGSFYLHFASKEDAFRQIVETMLARLATCIDAAPDGALAAEPEAHRAYWLETDLEVFEYVWQNRGLMRLLFEGGKSASFSFLVDEFAERARVHTKRWLAWGAASGLYRDDLDIEVASLVIAGAYDRVCRELVRQPSRPDLRAWVVALQAMIRGGIDAPAPAATVPDRRVSHRLQEQAKAPAQALSQAPARARAGERRPPGAVHTLERPARRPRHAGRKGAR